MSSLYRDLNEAALAANLNKNPLLVFHAMMNQTFGFDQTSQSLTDDCLSKLTGIRPDRLRGAVDVVVRKGLFERKPDAQSGNEYSIGKRFLEAHHNRLSKPFDPKKRPLPEKRKPFFGTNLKQPENRVNTATTPTTTASEAGVESESPSVKIYFAEREHIPDSFAIETSGATTRIEFAFGKPSTQTKPLAKASEAPAISKPDTTAKLKKINKIIKKPPQPIAQRAQTNKKPPAAKTATAVPAWHEAQDAAIAYLDRMAGSPEFNPKPLIVSSAPPKTVKQTHKTTPPNHHAVVPKVIGETNIPVCERQLRTLTPKQQHDVVLVFNHNLKHSTINSKTGYFLSLITAVKENRLTMPEEAIAKSPPSQQAKDAEKERAHRMDLWSNFIWLRDNAAREGVAIAELVKTADEKMQEAYAMFGQASL